MTDASDRLPVVLQITLGEYLSGVDVRAKLSRATYFRHRRALLPFGYDISAPRPAKGPRGVERCAADAWDWLDLGDVQRVAAAALRDAQAHQARPIPADEDPEGWHSREEFVESLAYVFGLRLAELARARGLAGPHHASRDLAAWLAPGGSGCAARAGASHD